VNPLRWFAYALIAAGGVAVLVSRWRAADDDPGWEQPEQPDEADDYQSPTWLEDEDVA
jgi:hypothetical protein